MIKKISCFKSTHFDINICFSACFISNQKNKIKMKGSFSFNPTIEFAFTYEDK